MKEHIGVHTYKRHRFPAAIIIHDHHVLLARRCNTGFADGLYSVIAGHVDGDEELREATAREARAEAGIRIDPADLQIVGVIHSACLTCVSAGECYGN